MDFNTNMPLVRLVQMKNKEYDPFLSTLSSNLDLRFETVLGLVNVQF